MFSVTAGDNSDIIFETNYDIIGCYIEDENFNLEALFLESPSTINEVVGIHEVYQQNMETEQTGNNSTVELDQEVSYNRAFKFNSAIRISTKKIVFVLDARFNC
ncbi:hypothetical protein GDO81_018636 [Engystomops pustulosus]|uniref:Uncharacterized protein n=1 Tax=Engystomops pustulosus TaxID=76066 RepID=A0AAV6Z063_ENGPU|nr:hypothetical protein GDO81_018636 [Engystomops pustulosus]KAG8540753.1 hypothetical protein GDO81_018636 [Engystomops pustulosus]